MDKKERVELMESFEAVALDAGLELDLSMVGGDYVEKLTKICYYFYVTGVELATMGIKMEEIDD